MITLEDLYARAVLDEETGCLEWQLSKNEDGYGYVWYQGKNHYAHRVAFALTNNVTLTTADYVCHECDNPSCVNPDHLFLGNQQQNMDNMTAKNRAARGERNGRAKLTQDQVLEIRVLTEAGATCRTLAERYNVHEGTVSDIKQNRIWAWL
jgi:hypothetical protein